MIDKRRYDRYDPAAAPSAFRALGCHLLKEGCALRSWKFWLGLVISAVFVWLTARGLEWREFYSALRNAQYGWLIPAVAVYFAAVWARTWRWHYMLRHMKPISVARLFPVVVIGYMGNNVYPARAGEFIRSYVLKKKEGVSVSASLATVALERLFDGLVMCAFVFVTLPFVPLPRLYQGIVIGFSALFFVALIVFLLLAANPDRTDALAARMITRLVPLRFRPRATTLASKFLIGLHALRSPRELLMMFVTSIAIWLTETGKYWVLAQAFPELNVNFAVLMLMTAVVNLATTIPSAPGYVGTFDKPGIEILKAFGQPANIAAAYTISLHVALWLPITLLGFFFMARESLRWRELEAVTREEQAPTPA
jgi:glycosyltransferase 2 family protein